MAKTPTHLALEGDLLAAIDKIAEKLCVSRTALFTALAEALVEERLWVRPRSPHLREILPTVVPSTVVP